MTEEYKAVNENWERYLYMIDNGHEDYAIKADRCDKFFRGIQWDEASLSVLREARRPALTINKILSTISNVAGEQIYNRTEIAFRPRNELATQEVADALTKTYMQISDNNQLNWVRSDVFLDGVIGSRGFYDVRLDFADSLMGEVRISQLDPKNVLIDPDATEYDPDTWNDVIVAKWLTLDDIELMYSKSKADSLRSNGISADYARDSMDIYRDRFAGSGRFDAYNRDTSQESGQYVRDVRVIERQHVKLDKVLHFADLVTGDLRPIPTSWDDNRIAYHLQSNPDEVVVKKRIRRVRWTVTADSDVLLHDDWSPYRHFSVVPYFPYFRRGRTVGIVENLLSPQELLNKSASQELHIVNTSANSGWILKNGALTNMEIGELEQRGAASGLVLEVDDIRNVEKIQPNQVPTGVDRIAYKAEEHIKSISGVSDYMQGFAREDVSARSVQANQRSGQANFAKIIDNLNRSDSILARNILELVQEFYTEERLIRVTQGNTQNVQAEIWVNQPTPEGEILNDLTLGEYSVIVTTQPERETFEDTQFDQCVMLRNEMGVPIPDDVLIRTSKLADKQVIIDAINGNKTPEQQQFEAQMANRKIEAEVAKEEANAQDTSAGAQLKMVRANKEQLEIAKLAQDEGNMSETQIKLLQMQEEMRIKQMQVMQEIELKREAQVAEIELKREAQRAELELKREQAARERAMSLMNQTTTRNSNVR